jgi:Fic family protein
MTWNWQLDRWPEFSFDGRILERYESTFLTSAGILVGTCNHLEEQDMSELRVELMCDEALKTSEIEGEFLNRQSIQSSIRRQFGLQAEDARIPAAEQGVSEMMVKVYQTWADPLSDQMLQQWHRMLMQGRRDLLAIGCYRSSTQPMQVVSGRAGRRRVHYEAPASNRVLKEMAAFNAWFNRTVPNGDGALPALTRAGLAHLWFVCIHPFEDGNGRIGRSVAEKALTQSLERPLLLALAHTMEAHRKSYYDALEQANRRLDITDWLLWFAETTLEAQEYTLACTRFLVEKAKLYARIGCMLNTRQNKVLARMFKEGPSGFAGGLSADNYITIAKTSPSTATRDLQDLVAMGALRRTGERKSTRYHLAIAG